MRSVAQCHCHVRPIVLANFFDYRDVYHTSITAVSISYPTEVSWSLRLVGIPKVAAVDT